MTKRGVRGMGNLSWLYICILSLQGLWICGASHFKERPSTLVILKYFHPPNDEGRLEDEDCTDPCTLNDTLLSKLTEEIERRQCVRPQPDCKKDRNSPYRTIDGRCNNLLNPDWGMALTCQRRILPHDYGDGASYPRMSCLKTELPKARVISNEIHKANKPKIQKDVTLHFMEWGQVISHDVTYSELHDDIPGFCCDPYPKVNYRCIAESVPSDDDFYIGKKTCLSFDRTRKCHLCTAGVRQSLNNCTSYFDLSIVYGSSEKRMRALRSFKNGMLRTQYIPGIGDLPPPIEKIEFCESFNSSLQCFNGGDDRIGQNVLLSTLQTVLLRFHNYVSMKLKKVNPHWNDERLFQETRRILIGLAQEITYSKYLKRLLGPGITKDPEFKLAVQPGKRFTNYDDTVDASVFDEFASAAHRFGHTMIPDTFLEKDPVSRRKSTIHLKDYFNSPFGFYSGQCDRLALGMTIQRPKQRTVTVNFEVRNYMYHSDNTTDFSGFDLAGLSIARGRDHGIPGYTHYLKHFFNFDVRSFCDLKGLIPRKTIEKMKNIYKSVHDVDLYTGMLAEYWVDGGIIGPTGAAIIATQYRNLKFGDRYYFEHRRMAGSFTPDQLKEIKSKASLARILCDTTKISRIQPDVFRPPSKSNKPVPCKELPKLNLKYWKEGRSRKQWSH